MNFKFLYGLKHAFIDKFPAGEYRSVEIFDWIIDYVNMKCDHEDIAALIIDRLQTDGFITYVEKWFINDKVVVHPYNQIPVNDTICGCSKEDEKKYLDAAAKIIADDIDRMIIEEYLGKNETRN